ncbi:MULTISPECIES: TRAP transporter small permease [Bordetella]|uniref:TRAP transporter small permease protein n=2 Tax=Bordetella TaxID=517 RepID=A0A261VSX8_9BORD|nr:MULTISPECIES: TRAP transporter small permease [Bordetella]MDM9560656.1 TRAP transporter small permease [Bordetella petrii]OZI76612.1 C4-dicarboxylate ABC transporter permease [Bordetella genomosp. 2]
MSFPDNDPPHATIAAPVRWIVNASEFVLRVERRLLSGFMALLVGLVLVNVATRYAGVPIYWIDEASVYAMVWLTFIGASIMTRLRLDFSVGMLTDQLGPRGMRAARIVATACVLCFGLALVWMCWAWMDPAGIARHGFDAQAYAADSFNFLYTERTQTLNWPTWVLRLVLPLFAVCLTLHALSNLFEDLAWVPRQSRKDFPVASPDMVN